MLKKDTFTAVLSPELKLLIACCQVQPDPDEIRSSLSTINDSLFTSMAMRHGVLPLVYKTLKSLPTTHYPLPTDILQKLKAAYMSIAHRNMLMTAELLRIMKLLEAHNIEALAFKGPVLSQMAYGDITLRQYGDLDILVDERDLYRTAQLIVSQGYEPMDSIEFLKNPAKLYVEKNYEFYGKRNGIKVEIHWRLINSPFLKAFRKYDPFSLPEKIKINHVPIPTLDSEILLLYLCNHGASHMWERLEWIVDIDRLVRIRKDTCDWGEIMELASSLQSRTTLLLGLGLSDRLFSTPLPRSIQTILETPRMVALVTQVLHTFETDLITKDHTSHEKNFAVFKFHLALQDSFPTKTGFVLQTIFGYSDRDIMMVNLPRPLFFLYYPLRIIRIINKYTLKPLASLFVGKDQKSAA